MKLLIKKARLIATGNPRNGQIVDLLIEDGQIIKLGANITAQADREIASPNLHLSAGWFDSFVETGEPGFEDKEDLSSVTTAAAAGGFTKIAISPNTQPAADNATIISATRAKSSAFVCDVLPIGAGSVQLKGEDMAELFDMTEAGAIAFTDGRKAFQNADLLKRLLIYAKPFNGRIIQFPQDKNLTHGGQINEGVVSTALGLKGIAELAESVLVARDIDIAAYAESPLHFNAISSKKSIQLITEAQLRGQQISAGSFIQHLAFTDQLLSNFEVNYKIWPPLRSEATRKALVNALNAGIINCLSANHSPQTYEDKVCEFDLASFGAIGLQTFYPIYNGFLKQEISINRFVDSITSAPRQIFNLPQVRIEEGQAAELTLFDPELSWNFNANTNYSKSINSSFYGKDLKGKVLGVINGKKYFLNSF